MSKFQGYTNGYSPITLWSTMPKRINEELVSFGERLVTLRKTAGYTQQELADEIGVTRRMIVYYERESEHPPTTLLTDLARALGVTTDELLGVKKIKKVGKSDNRLLRRFQQIEKLDPKEKRQVIQILDTFIENEQLRRKTNS